MISRLKHLFLAKNPFTSAAAILIFTTLLSNIFGLIRDRFFAQKITTDLLDTYFAAFRVPDLIFNVLILGTISAAFIPVFLEYKTNKGQAAAWEIVSLTLNLIILVMIGLAILLFLLMPILMPLIVPEFSIDKQSLTVYIARILLIQPILFGISYLFSGVLNALKRFLVYSLAPLIYTLAIILSTVIFAPEYGVKALAYGVVAGSFLHMSIQFLAAFKIGFRWQGNFKFNHPAIKEIIKLMLPRSIGLGALQITLLVFTAIASSLDPGSVTIYNFADNIQTMPTAVFGLSFITALYPTISEQIAEKKFHQMVDYVWRGIRYLLFIMVPASLGLILLRTEIVRLILGSGHFFDWEATVNTANTLGLFSVSLFAQAIGVLLARSFYATQDTKTPTITNVLSYIIAIIAAFVFSPKLGVMGLALAFSIGAIVNLLLLYARLRTRFPLFKTKEKELFLIAGQLLIGSIVLVVSVQLVKDNVGNLVDMQTGLGVLIKTLGAIMAGVISYWLVMRLFNVPELSLAEQFIMSKIKPIKEGVSPIDLEDLSGKSGS